jgi:hypothetical protein
MGFVVLCARSLTVAIFATTATACGNSVRESDPPPATPSAVAIVSPSTAAPSASQSIGACSVSHFQIKVVAPGFGAGNVGAWLEFKNVGAETCEMQGWPTFIGVSGTGAESPARRVPTVMTFPDVANPPDVSLRPGELAFAAYNGGDTPPAGMQTCPPPFETFKVGLPGNDTTTMIPGWNEWLGGPQPSCTGLDITPLVPATSLPADQLQFLIESSSPLP